MSRARLPDGGAILPPACSSRNPEQGDLAGCGTGSRPRNPRPCTQPILTCSRRTRWEEALLDLARHYHGLGTFFYGSYVHAFHEAMTKGCKNRREFRTVVANILDMDKWAPWIVQMANAAATGTLQAALAGGRQ